MSLTVRAHAQLQKLSMDIVFVYIIIIHMNSTFIPTYRLIDVRLSLHSFRPEKPISIECFSLFFLICLARLANKFHFGSESKKRDIFNFCFSISISKTGVFIPRFNVFLVFSVLLFRLILSAPLSFNLSLITPRFKSHVNVQFAKHKQI